MKKSSVLLLPALLLVAFPGIGLADDAGLRRCRLIADPPARLACYDALVPGAASAPAAPPATPAPAREASPALVERFGMEHKGPAQSERIESHIPGRFQGWRANSRIRLANGQVWQVVDNSWFGGEWDNPKVAIRRGAFGSFYLDIEGENRSPRVRRVE